MTTLRQPYYELSPAVYNALVQAKTALENSTLDTTLMELDLLRLANQRLRILSGDAQQSIAQIRRATAQTGRLAGWRVSHHFDERGGRRWHGRNR